MNTKHYLKKWTRGEGFKEQEELIKELLTLEHLDTNSLGSYTMGTWLAAPTRKYHGLLVAALSHLEDKWVLLNSLEESIIDVDGSIHNLNGHYYHNSDLLNNVASYLQTVERLADGHMAWMLAANNWRVIREQLLVLNENSVLCRYRIHNNTDKTLTLQLRPLLSFRNFHQLLAASDTVKFAVNQVECGSSFERQGAQVNLEEPVKLYIQSSAQPKHTSQNFWYYNALYPQEAARGYDAKEDLFCPECFEYEITPGEHEIVVIASTTEHDASKLKDLWNDELAARLADRLESGPELMEVLKVGASKFIVKQDRKPAKITAGFPWFLAWGRDSMIALPGLLISQRHLADARMVLNYYARHLRDGLLPNCLGTNECQYNSADASLWMVWAIQQYWLASAKDSSKIWYYWSNALVAIWRRYSAGTHGPIKVDAATGLLTAGDANTNLTWMDAKINDQPVTSRYGYVIELNALWYNFLNFLLELHPPKHILSVKETSTIRQQIAQFEHHFMKVFWYEAGGYFYDYVAGNVKNSQLRPNQLLAISLPYTVVAEDHAKQALAKVAENLFTPYGLRTLAPSDPNYCGHYAGDQKTRDQAYHNGTVWPWLLGCFFDSALKYLDLTAVKDYYKRCVEALGRHLLEGCVGGIAEVFDGDEPHSAGGCVDQAWSVGELLRIQRLMEAKLK